MLQLAKKTVFAIINPISGVHQKDHVPMMLNQFLDANKFDLSITFTQYAGHATELAQRAVSENADYVIAIGGDGTINEIARALVHSNCALAIIPYGSGNGLARHLRIPLEVSRAIKIINDENIIQIDYGKANDHIFFCTAGVGFDAWISKKFAEDKHRGKLTYVKNVLIEYIKYQPRTYRIIANGKEIIEKAFVVVCANASQYGNEAYIAPNASMQDGLMNITVLKPFNHLEVPILSVQLFTKNIDKSNKFESFQKEELQIILNKPEVMHVDGEPIMMEDVIHIKTIKKGLRVVTPISNEKSLIEPLHEAFDFFQYQLIADLKGMLNKKMS